VRVGNEVEVIPDSVSVQTTGEKLDEKIRNSIVEFVNDGWNLIEEPQLESVVPEPEYSTQPNWNKLDVESLSNQSERTQKVLWSYHGVGRNEKFR
jgi:hypothetical protein